jgi:hypothetical protein
MIRNAGPSWAKNAFKKVARVRTLEPMKCDTSTFRARFGALVEGQIDKLSRLTEESKFAEWAAEGRRGIVG